jgi:glycine/D-amino acid oxidase-like deaminating enzyme
MEGILEYPYPNRVGSDVVFPKKIDVAIIGGGIIGVSTAFALAEQGVEVAIFEKGEIANEQSCRNWGFCRTAGRDIREIPLAIESLRCWDHLQTVAGTELGFRRPGIIHGSTKEKDLAVQENWLDKAKQFGVSSKIINQKELASLMGEKAASTMVGAMYTPDDGRAEPTLAASGIALAAHKLGVKIYNQCAVRGFETTGGKIGAVVTEKGKVECNIALIAGGAWSSTLCRGLGLRFPQLAVRTPVMHVEARLAGPAFDASFFNIDDFAMRKRLDGSYTISRGTYVIADVVPDSFRFLKDFIPLLKLEHKHIKIRAGKRFVDHLFNAGKQALDKPSIFEKHRILDPEPDIAMNMDAFAKMPKLFSEFEGARIIRHWAGYIDATPDTVPVISAIDDIPGLHLASGFSGHGFGIGPGAGYLMADIIMNKSPRVDPKPYRFSRMNDGTKFAPQCGV